jgi:hypothetical protein
MPRAGFYAIQATTIRFGRDGNWYADDEQITNPRIADLFSRHVVRDPAGGYMIRMGDERAHIVVDDTPYVVISASTAPGGNVNIELNDRSVEQLDASSLQSASNDVLYCQVKEGRERARFLRPAYYQLAPHIREFEPSRFVLEIGGKTYAIQRA